MDEKLRKAQCLARFILKWHRQFGKSRMQEVACESYPRYLGKLDFLHALDLTEPEHLRQIANEQISGIFEYVYAERIPETLWNEVVQSVFVDLHMPKHLGDVAHLILRLLQDSKSEVAITPFQLPDGWRRCAVSLRPGSTRLPLKPGGTPRQTLRNYFANLSEMEDLGIGGCELMVAMNEDCLEEGDMMKDYTIAYNPASFNFQLATGEGNFVTQIIRGEILIGEVLLDCSPDYAEKANTE